MADGPFDHDGQVMPDRTQTFEQIGIQLSEDFKCEITTEQLMLFYDDYTECAPSICELAYQCETVRAEFIKILSQHK